MILNEEKEGIKVANVLIGKIEVALEDVIQWLGGVHNFVLKSSTVVTALAQVVVAVGAVVEDAQADFSNPSGMTSITLQNQQLQDLKAVWADVKAAFAAAGIKI